MGRCINEGVDGGITRCMDWMGGWMDEWVDGSEEWVDV